MLNTHFADLCTAPNTKNAATKGHVEGVQREGDLREVDGEEPAEDVEVPDEAAEGPVVVALAAAREHLKLAKFAKRAHLHI